MFFILGLTISTHTLLAEDRNEEGQTNILETSFKIVIVASSIGKKVKNIILMIDDGMSEMHVYTVWTANRGKLNLDNCQVVGLSKTYCADKLITDSGASATAMATGQKKKLIINMLVLIQKENLLNH